MSCDPVLSAVILVHRCASRPRWDCAQLFASEIGCKHASGNVQMRGVSYLLSSLLHIRLPRRMHRHGCGDWQCVGKRMLCIRMATIVVTKLVTKLVTGTVYQVIFIEWSLSPGKSQYRKVEAMAIRMLSNEERRPSFQGQAFARYPTFSLSKLRRPSAEMVRVVQGS